MKYSTTTSRKDMIDYINELEARLEQPKVSPSDDEQQVEIKVFNSYEDLLTYKIENGLVDIPEEREGCGTDNECSNSDCEIEQPDSPIDECSDTMDLQVIETVSAVLASCKFKAEKNILSHSDISALSTLISTVKGYEI